MQYIMSEEELSFLYDYSKNVITPCVRNAGYYVSPMPSREDFVQQQHGWWPYEAVQSGRHYELLFENLLMRCPDVPAGWYER